MVVSVVLAILIKFVVSIKLVEEDIMMKEPLLSVIIPVYGTEKLVPRCLDSIIKSSYKNIEIVVVDDKSPGNIAEIISFYEDIYPNITFIRHQANKGLYAARISGVEAASGDYIAFLDSDDRVSCDFYRRLIQKAELDNADMVIGEYVLEFPNGTYQYQNYSHTRLCELSAENEDVLKCLLQQKGSDYSLWVVWNKIYHKSIWEKALPYLKQQKRHLIMCEDILYSTVLYAFSERLRSVKGDYVFYYKDDGSSTSRASLTYDKILKNINDISYVFECIYSIYQELGILEVYRKYISAWHLVLKKTWFQAIKESGLLWYKQRSLIKALDIENKEDECALSSAENYFYSHYTQTKLLGETLKEKIIDPDIEVVSFDIFDTLVFRPFTKPHDLFTLLAERTSTAFNLGDKNNVKQLRIDAERIARDRLYVNNKSYDDITLDEIYDVFNEISNLDSRIVQWIKNDEIQLELKYCYTRQYAKELFDLARYTGKKVIINSDMYLPKNVIIQILNNCGYSEYDDLFLSSETRVMKHTGKMYRYISNVLGVSGKHILHIGDTESSDIKKAKECGWNSFLLPKAIDLLQGKNPDIYTGEAYQRIFAKSFLLRGTHYYERFLGLNACLGVIANTLFDNPFSSEFMNNTDFNADPKVVGTYVLGPYLYGISYWLANSIKKHEYDSINFLARDGFLPMKAYDIVSSIIKPKAKVNYVRTSREALLPFQIQSKLDLDNLRQLNINVYSQSPESFINMLKPFLAIPVEMAKSIVENHHIIYNQKFKSNDEWYKFITLFGDQIYSQEKIDRYRETLREAYSKIFIGKSATFDVGYSFRLESTFRRCFDFDIDGFYVHINEDTAYSRALHSSGNIYTFLDYGPGVTGLIRELLLSAQEPSLKRIFINDNNEIDYVFKDYSFDYKENFIVSLIQNSAIKFVSDIVNIFKDDLKYLYSTNSDLALIHEYFNHMAKEKDRTIFTPLIFEDKLFVGGNVNFKEFWDNQIRDIDISFASGSDYVYWMRPVWKRAICLYFINRDFLKEKVNNKLKNRPIILHGVKYTYKGLRYIYRLFK